MISPPWLADRELSQQQGDVIMTYRLSGYGRTLFWTDPITPYGQSVNKTFVELLFAPFPVLQAHAVFENILTLQSEVRGSELIIS